MCIWGSHGRVLSHCTTRSDTFACVIESNQVSSWLIHDLTVLREVFSTFFRGLIIMQNPCLARAILKKNCHFLTQIHIITSVFIDLCSNSINLLLSEMTYLEILL